MFPGPDVYVFNDFPYKSSHSVHNTYYIPGMMLLQYLLKYLCNKQLKKEKESKRPKLSKGGFFVNETCLLFFTELSVVNFCVDDWNTEELDFKQQNSKLGKGKFPSMKMNKILCISIS